MAIAYLTCPKCSDEIEFQIEWDSADDFAGYNATYMRPQPYHGCKCEFTDSEIEAMEIEVADNYRQAVYED